MNIGIVRGCGFSEGSVRIGRVWFQWGQVNIGRGCGFSGGRVNIGKGGRVWFQWGQSRHWGVSLLYNVWGFCCCQGRLWL